MEVRWEGFSWVVWGRGWDSEGDYGGECGGKRDGLKSDAIMGMEMTIRLGVGLSAADRLVGGRGFEEGGICVVCLPAVGS